MSANELNEFFHMAKIPPPVSTGEVLKAEPTESQKNQIWLQLKLQEEMFKKEKDTIFKTYK